MLSAAGCERAPKRPEPTPIDAAQGIAEDELAQRFACLDEALDVDPRYEPIARALCSDLHHLDGVGASIAIAEQGELRFELAIGKACANGDRLVQRSSQFRIGSITKTLTAAATLGAAHDNRLSLEHPITEYLPEFALAEGEHAAAITLRHLLSHTSGLPELSAAETARLSNDDWFTAWAGRPRWAEPGRVWHYSNSGFALVGTVLERVFRQPFARVVEETVFEPLALTEIGFDAAAATQAGSAVCGHPGRGDRRAVLDVESDFDPEAAGGWATPAGAALASARDLARFGLGLLEPNGILDASSRRDMFSAQAQTGNEAADAYGLGIARRELSGGLVVLRHAGNTGDFAADLYLVPDKGFALAILSNTNAHFRATAEAVFRERLGVSLAPPKSSEPTRKTAAHVGEYRVAGWSDPIRVTFAADGSLRLSSSQLRIDNIELRPTVADAFQVTWPALGVSERITFVFEDATDTAWIRGPSFLGRREAARPD